MKGKKTFAPQNMPARPRQAGLNFFSFLSDFLMVKKLTPALHAPQKPNALRSGRCSAKGFCLFCCTRFFSPSWQFPLPPGTLIRCAAHLFFYQGVAPLLVLGSPLTPLSCPTMSIKEQKLVIVPGVASKPRVPALLRQFPAHGFGAYSQRRAIILLLMGSTCFLSLSLCPGF